MLRGHVSGRFEYTQVVIARLYFITLHGLRSFYVMQTTVYHCDKLYEFNSERERHDLDVAENDGVILFLKHFFPSEAKRWIMHQLMELNELYNVVDEAGSTAEQKWWEQYEIESVQNEVGPSDYASDLGYELSD